MIITRTLSLALRAFQFLFSAIILGLVSSFLHDRHKYTSEDAFFNRLIYCLIVAALSLVLSLLWMLPTINAIIHWGMDLCLAAAWFAIFGLLQGWYTTGLLCGREWAWEQMWKWANACGKWNAAQAFSFMAAVLWFVSFVLGLLVWAKRDRGGASADGAAVAPAGRRRHWWKKSAV